MTKSSKAPRRGKSCGASRRAIAVRLRPDVIKALDAEARKQGRTRSNTMEYVLAAFLANRGHGVDLQGTE